MLKRVLQHTFAFLLIGTSLYYLGRLTVQNSDKILTIASNLPPSIVISSVLLSLMGGITNSYIWYRINKHLSTDTRFYLSYFAWSVSRIFRYIPGKAFGYIIRHKLQKSSVKHGVKSSINEALLSIMTLLLLSSTYFLTQWNNTYFIILFFFTTLLYLILVLSKPISKLLDIALTKLNISVETNRLLNPPKQLFYQSLLGLPALLLHGMSFHLLFKYGLDASTAEFLNTTVTFYLSGIIGQLSLLAPAGLGVREASLTLFMVNQGHLSEVALSAAIASRFILIASELLNVLLSSIIRFILNHD